MKQLDLKFSALSGAWLLMSLASSAQAAKPSDFFCREAPGDGNSILFSKISAQACGGKDETKLGVCMLRVECAHIDDTIADAAQSKFKKKFSALTTLEKKAAVDEGQGEYLPTTLTCAGKPNAGQPLCPLPEKCKGDVLFGMKAANFETEKEQLGIIERVNGHYPDKRPDPHYFQTGEEPAGAAQ